MSTGHVMSTLCTHVASAHRARASGLHGHLRPVVNLYTVYIPLPRPLRAGLKERLYFCKFWGSPYFHVGATMGACGGGQTGAEATGTAGMRKPEAERGAGGMRMDAHGGRWAAGCGMSMCSLCRLQSETNLMNSVPNRAPGGWMSKHNIGHPFLLTIGTWEGVRVAISLLSVDLNGWQERRRRAIGSLRPGGATPYLLRFAGNSRSTEGLGTRMVDADGVSARLCPANPMNVPRSAADI